MKKIQLPLFKYQIVAIILLLSFSCIATVSATEITVGTAGEDHSSISAALANATDGDTIIVSDGTYNENIVVDREVIIRSQSGAANTIVNSSSGNDTFDITASNVTINGFTVTGASASSMAGIYLESNLNCTISNNIVTGNKYGIFLYSSSNNSLANNTANGNYCGIKLYHSSNNNELTNNNAINNDNNGIDISSSSNNYLISNNASDNNHGFSLSSSSNNNLTSNNANNNDARGISLSSSSDNNNLTNNTASNNDFGIRFFSSSGNNMTGNIMSLNTYNFNVNMLNSNLDDLLHDIDDSNKVDGKSIYYWTNRADEEVPSDAGIVYVVNSTNITVKNIEVANEYSGIVFAYTINSTIENTTTSECGDGIYLYHSNVNELTDNNVNANDDDGICLYSSDYNNLTSNNASDNKEGIFLSSSEYNNLTSNNANSNDNYGIYLSSSDNNDLTNNNANNNNAKDLYASSSSSCTVDRLALTDNLAQLSFVTDSSSTSIIGSETNANVLSGKTNVNDYTTIDRSGDLNVTFFYDDSGMSSSGESSVALYRLDGSIWVEVANASLNTSGNYLSVLLSEFGTFGIFRDTEISSSPSSSPSSSGTRVSVSQGQNPEIVETTAASTLRVVKGSEVNYDFSDSGTPVLGVSFDAKDNEGLVVAKVQVLSDTPKGIPSPSGTSYQLMSIDVGNEGTISTDNADNVLILFKVSREWIEENDIDVSSIRMTRYHGEQWQNLPTIQVKEDDEFICFSAETPGFSVFNVVGDKIGEVVAVEETGTSLPADEETETQDTPGFTGLAGIVIVSLAFLVSRKLKSD